MSDTNPRTTGNPGIDALAGALARLRSRARRLLIVRGVAPIVTGAALAVVTLALLDYALRMPALLRGAFWIAGVGGLVELLRRGLLPALRFGPSLTEVALRVEHRNPQAGGLLASGLELASAPRDDRPAASWLRGQVIARAAQASERAKSASILRPAGAARSALGAALAISLAAVLALWNPTLASIGARRVLTPWAAVSWPKRTGVADATTIAVHPLGSALPLRAAVTRSDQPEGGTLVTARYRLIQDGHAGPTRRITLSPQRRTVEVFDGEDAPGGSGELYERLIEPAGLVAAGAQPAEVEYWFETADDRTGEARILLVEPPRIVGASATVQPPAYAGGAVAGGAAIVAGDLDLGPGTDSRALVGPVLAGSRVRLAIDLNKPVPLPGPGQAEDWAAATFGDAALAAAVRAPDRSETERLVLDLTLTEPLRLTLSVTDRHGLTGTEESTYTFETVQDRGPSASVTEPPEDETVLASAAIDLVGEGRDDAGLDWVALEQQLARPPPGSIGAPAEARTERAEIARQAGQSAMQARVVNRLDLAALDLEPGDEVWLTALAKDTFDLGDAGHEPSRSTVRRLRIISDEQLVEQIRAELSSVRRSAMRLDEAQAELERATQRQGAAPENRASQAGLTERLASQRQTLSRLLDRAQRNNLDDPVLESLIDEASRLAAGAANASSDASAAMNTGRAPDPELTPEEQEKAQNAQERVRDNLGRLVDLLDRGEDSWLVRRDLQRLLDEQKELIEQTRDATEDTIGRDASQLSPQERATLEQVAQRQDELADRAAQALEDLRQRAEQTRDEDPAQADAMDRAAQTGRQQNVPSQQRSAAQNVRDNQGQNAQQQQQQAAEALEEMLDELDGAQRDRDEVLRRILMSVADSLRALVAHQEREIASLDRADTSRDFSGLDAGMASLHRNTLALAAQTRSSARELAALADLVEAAATPQSVAVRILRAAPVDEPGAREQEEISLARLNEALAETERLAAEAAQRSTERKRAELRRAYREILELQVSLRDETASYADKELSRKQRVKIRRLGERQGDIRAQLADIQRSNQEVRDAAVFDFAHSRMDVLAQRAAEALTEGEASPGAVHDQRGVVRILQSLLDSLAENRPEDSDEFREGQGGSGQGQQGRDELIPPIAELRVLRGLQQLTAETTRALDEAGDPTPEQIDDVGALQDSLAEQGRKLIERLNSPQGLPGGAGGGAGPGGDPGGQGPPSGGGS